MNSARHRGLLHDDGIRAMRVDVQEIAAHAARIHGLGGAAAALQADALAAAALLAAYLDDGERLTVQLQLEVPRLAFTADVHPDGRIRCRTTPPRVVSVPHMRGMLFIAKSVEGREVYRGITAVDHADFGAVLQEHLAGSAQVPAMVRVGGGRGAFVEKMPGQAEDISLSDVLEQVWEELEGEKEPLEWACTCSRERVVSMLISLGEAEIQAMIDEDDGATVNCNYCRTEQVFSASDLRALLPT